VRRISDLPDGEAGAALRACCASARWVTRMLSQRPFRDAADVLDSGERIWWELGREDWLEAFAAHPRIGEKTGDGGTGGRGDSAHGAGWAAQEQARVSDASADMKARLAQANRDYEAKFGWIYLVCATGKSAEEMLAFAQQRMANAPDAELRVAAAEQAKITALRLGKLLEIGA
jgi:2-oxo-4-hydroxy-4-carboxy-5-ureidoimidazoline decarboxylase